MSEVKVRQRRCLDLKTLQGELVDKADKTIVSNNNDGLMSINDKKKLDGIDIGANKYVHPDTHTSNEIKTNPSRRFTSDTEISEILDRIENIDKTGDGSITGELAIELSNIKNKMRLLFEKQLEILIYLELTGESSVDSTGYWFDTLIDESNIQSKTNLNVNTDRRRIMGDKGNVIFNEIQLPFKCSEITYIHEMDDNFVDAFITNNASSGSSKIRLEKYSYEIK